MDCLDRVFPILTRYSCFTLASSFIPLDKDNHKPITFDIGIADEKSLTGNNKIVKSIHLNAKDVTDNITATLGNSISSSNSFIYALTALNLPLD